VIGIGGLGYGATGQSALWLHQRSTGCWQEVREAWGDGGTHEVIVTGDLEGTRVAFYATWDISPSEQRCELRLIDLVTRDRQLLDANTSAIDGGVSGCTMRPIALEYPWVVWRDIRQVGSFRGPWDVYAMNIETGERLNLSIDPDTGDRLWSDVVEVDLESGLTVFGASWEALEPVPGIYSEIVSVDLNSGARQQLTNAPGAQWYGTVTEDWVAWVDPREDPLRDAYSLCHTDIYGFDRRTGTEHALAIDGDGMRGPTVDGEGPWLAYSDQRWDPYPECDSDQEQSIVALHLPTMTEIRITDWPGFEAEPRVYDRRDGTYGVLFIEEIDYVDAIYRLWDCDLPAP
jgi:hypothetical protein